jgi:hypothetical protein
VLAYGSGFKVFDLSIPTSPREIGSFAGEVCSVSVSGDHAFYADISGYFGFIDLCDPHASLLRPLSGRNPIKTEAYVLTVSGNYAYLAHDSGDLTVIDVSDRNSLSAVGDLEVGFGIVLDIASSGHFLFVSGVRKLRVFDVQDPTRPTELGSIDGAGHFAVSGERLLVASGREGLKVYRNDFPIAGPVLRQPTDVTGLRGQNAAFSAEVDPGIVASIHWQKDGVDLPNESRFVGAHSGRLEVQDLEATDAGEYSLVVTFPGGTSTSEVASLRVQQPVQISFVGKCSVAGYGSAVTLSGHYAFLASGEKGLQVIDVSDPTSPQLAGGYDTPGNAHDALVSGNHAFVADGWEGLKVIDISDPTSPQLAGGYDRLLPALGIAVDGDNAYVASEDTGLQVINISDPTSPQLVGSYDTPGKACGVVVSGNHAFVADRVGGLQVIDISDSTSPQEVGRVETASLAKAVTMAGDHVYIAEAGLGLEVVDVSAPASPQIVWGVNNQMGHFAPSIAVDGDYAYFAAEGMLQVIDISDPTSPYVVGRHRILSSWWGVAAAGEYVYVAGGEPAELQILTVSPVLRLPPSSLQTLSRDEFGFRVSSEPGQQLEIQVSEDLESWTGLNTVTSSEGHADLLDLMEGRDHRFYRLQLEE